MLILLTFLHVIVCLFLILVVLLQSGKAADLAGAFGGMGSQTAFGPRGAATALSKATTIAAVLFMATSLGLSIVATRRGGGTTTVLQSVPEPKKDDKKANPTDNLPRVTIAPEGMDPNAVPSVPLQLPPRPEEQKQGAKPEQKK